MDEKSAESGTFEEQGPCIHKYQKVSDTLFVCGKCGSSMVVSENDEAEEPDEKPEVPPSGSMLTESQKRHDILGLFLDIFTWPWRWRW
jgi:hypothetical protein